MLTLLLPTTRDMPFHLPETLHSTSHPAQDHQGTLSESSEPISPTEHAHHTIFIPLKGGMDQFLLAHLQLEPFHGANVDAWLKQSKLTFQRADFPEEQWVHKAVAYCEGPAAALLARGAPPEDWPAFAELLKNTFRSPSHSIS